MAKSWNPRWIWRALAMWGIFIMFLSHNTNQNLILNWRSAIFEAWICSLTEIMLNIRSGYWYCWFKFRGDAANDIEIHFISTWFNLLFEYSKHVNRLVWWKICSETSWFSCCMTREDLCAKSTTPNCAAESFWFTALLVRVIAGTQHQWAVEMRSD